MDILLYNDLMKDRADETILEDKYKVKELVNTLFEVMENNKELVSLSAPQLGINSRLFVIRFSNGELKYFANPMITKTDGMHLSREKSPSIPNKEFIVPRYNDIQVTYQTPNGKIESNMFQGAPSEVFQQMVNQLDGISICDFGLEVLEGWDEATEEERQEVIDLYLKSINEENLELSKEIKETPKLKQINDAIEFMTGVANGTIETIQKEHKLNREQRRLKTKLEKKLSKVSK